MPVRGKAWSKLPCPVCGSRYQRQGPHAWRTVEVPAVRRYHHCLDCGHVFRSLERYDFTDPPWPPNEGKEPGRGLRGRKINPRRKLPEAGAEPAPEVAPGPGVGPVSSLPPDWRERLSRALRGDRNRG